MTLAVLFIPAVIGKISNSGGELIYRESNPYGAGGSNSLDAYFIIQRENAIDDTLSTADISPQTSVVVKININTATEKELADILPGIGEKKAHAIVEYREYAGGFRSVDELLEVDGIGAALLEKIRPYCVLSDEDMPE